MSKARETQKNSHGLPRYITADVSRKIRQACGFGCVVCGDAFYQYHHVDPPYAEAKTHDPDKIVLLCPACHDKILAGMLSNETVMKRAKNPKCREKNFSKTAMYIGDEKLRVILGNNSLTNVGTLVQFGEEKFLSVEPPEESGGPFRLTVHFYDDEGKELARIVQNEWLGLSANWDIELDGAELTIRRKKRDIVLRIRSDAPHGIRVEKLHMLCKGFEFSLLENGDFQVLGPKNPEGKQFPFVLHGNDFEGLGLGLHIPGADDPMWMSSMPANRQVGITFTNCVIRTRPIA